MRILLTLLFTLWTVSVWAGQPERSIMLRWDSSAGAERYRLYYGEASGHYTVVLNTGIATSASVSGLKPGQLYYFAATALNEWGESSYSNEVSARGRQ